MTDSNENLEEAKSDQKRVGAAESNPKTTGPADNLREDAAEAVDEEEDSADPRFYFNIYVFVTSMFL